MKSITNAKQLDHEDGCQYLNRLNKLRAQEKGNAGQLQQLEKESEEQLNLRRKLEQLTEDYLQS